MRSLLINEVHDEELNDHEINKNFMKLKEILVMLKMVWEGKNAFACS